jgi:hypothetical protein
MLYRTGKMLASVSSESAGLLRMGKSFVRFGTRLPYARAQQYANNRMFLCWTDAMRAKVTDAIDAYHQFLLGRAIQKLDAMSQPVRAADGG